MSNNILFDSTRIVNQRKKRVMVYFIILAIALLLWLPGSWLKQNFFPFISGGVGGFINSVKNDLLGWGNKSLDNLETEKLKEENLALLQENASLKEKVRDNSTQFGFDNVKNNYNLVEAKIIGKDSFFNTPLFYILAGKNNGLRNGLPVLDSNGVLLGIIKENQGNTSQVALTANHESRIGARVAGTDWDGIVEGNRDLRAVMEMLPLESKVKQGDQVVTDNRNPDVPEGLVIGSVDLIKESDDHLFNQAVLELPWSSKNMDKVWVITGRK